ncbi:MAG: preprotein translocase subunit SecE [Anaerolineae bacterium]
MARSKTEKRSFFSWLRDNALVQYLRETRAELRKVHWPSRQEAENLTKIVLIVTVSMAALMGLLDYLFSLELRGLINSNVVAIGVLVFVTVASIIAAVIVSRQTT